ICETTWHPRAPYPAREDRDAPRYHRPTRPARPTPRAPTSDSVRSSNRLAAIYPSRASSFKWVTTHGPEASYRSNRHHGGHRQAIIQKSHRVDQVRKHDRLFGRSNDVLYDLTDTVQFAA